MAGLGSKPFRARQLMNWIYKRGAGDFAAMTDLAKDFRAQLAERAEIRTPEIVTVAAVAPTARASGCCARTRRRPSRWCSSRSRSAARCASPRRSAARSTARSAPRRSRASTATSPPPRSSARCGCQVASSAVRGRPDGDARRSPTSCSWAWASRWRTSATWCRRCASCWTTLGFDLSRRRVTLSHLRASCRRSTSWPKKPTWRSPCRCTRPNDALRNELVPINRKHPIAELLRGLLALHRRAERPQRHVRVRDARWRQRLAGAGARSSRGC